MSDPTIPEVVRRLDDVVRSIDRIMLTMETSYVRRDVYEARHDAVRADINGKVQDIYGDIKEIRDQRASDVAFRRQILAGAAIGLILLLVNLVIATSNFVNMGGSG